jgi:4-hydroxy-3-methylbut-2-enyl diphosphate reductase IspH
MWPACSQLQTEKLAVVTQTTLSVDDAAEFTAAVRAAIPQACVSPSSKTSATPRKTARTP